MTATRPPLAYSLERCSTGRQQGGDTFERQSRLASEWIERDAPPGVRLDDRLDLRGVGSASKGDMSPPLRRFRDAVSCGRVLPGDYLLIEDLSRLSRRKPVEAAHLLTGILLDGIKVVVTSSGKIYSEDEEGELHTALAGAQAAHEYARQLMRRAASSWQAEHAEIRAGRRFPRNVPWWCTGGGQIKPEPIPDRVEIARRIVRMSADGLGGGKIAVRLNEQGDPGPSGKGWATSTVGNVLRDERLTGVFRVGGFSGEGEPVPCLPRILSDEEFASLRRRTKSRSKNGNAPRTNPNSAGLWAGVITDVRDGTGVMRCRSKTKPGATQRWILQGEGSRSRGTPSAPLDADWSEHCLLGLISMVDPADLAGPDPESAPLQEAVEAARAAAETAKNRLDDARSVYDEEGGREALRAASKWAEKLEVAEIALAEAIAVRDARPGAASVAETRTVLGLLRVAEPDDVAGLRTRLSGLIRETIDGIDLRPIRALGWRVGLFSVRPRRGGDHVMNVLALTRVGSTLKVPVRWGLVWRTPAPGIAHDRALANRIARKLDQRIVDTAAANRNAWAAVKSATGGAGYLLIDREGQEPDPDFVAIVAAMGD